MDMELPPRASGDQLLRAGELTDIIRRLRLLAPRHELATVIACAFDRRTRMLPFFYADVRMAPAGVRAIGSAMTAAGFTQTRIVLQQWNPNFRPSRMLLEGRTPDLFMISSMSLHAAACGAMIRDAWRIPPEHRPLIIAGGTVCIYEPWLVFGVDESAPCAADVAVTGEEYVLLSLLETLLAFRSRGESIRAAFARARDSGALDRIPGLMYSRTDDAGRPRELVDTGIQRLLGDLDELPGAELGYQLLEPPGRGPGLAPQALSAGEVRRYSPIGSLVLTLGCKFSCNYCPIPGYNQRHFRFKSAPRISEEIFRLRAEYGLRNFFGTDDNFFNDRKRALEIVETLARDVQDNKRLGKRIRWGTEATVHDTLRMKDHLALVHRAGVRALWLGVEDMSGALVLKGQDTNRTIEVFELLRLRGICPMPMMMHHDAQPLLSRPTDQGLLNQVRLLRKAGAVGLQVLMITPSAGSRKYEETFTSGQVFRRVAGRPVEPYMYDGNYVIASSTRDPWRKQFNILITYLSFYNPLRLVAALAGHRSRLGFKPAGVQIVGMWGLAHTVWRTFGWALRLLTGRIERLTSPPASTIPVRSPDGGPASHVWKTSPHSSPP
jgi:radical SAM superfamily enzyme YgiQ (UPF0313 family)